MTMSARTDLSWSAETASERTERALAGLAEDPAAASVFTRDLGRVAREQAARAPDNTSPLAGAITSIKALFDVAGETTTAGAKVLQGEPPAERDAPVIARLREAGAIFLGLTNMSEFAYSGLGLNPHYGTPDNPAYPGCAPGGSSSGGAVSVALGLCDIAIGSDTGGSLRIPAAFTGITGFKPTQETVPLTGGKPLSDTLDSFGPMARSVADCELAWQVMAGLPAAPKAPEAGRLVVARNFGFDEMDPVIAEGFEAILPALRDTGFEIVERDLGCIDLYGKFAPWQMTSVESRAHYEDLFQGRAEDFDPRVHSRMFRADELNAVGYRQAVNDRNAFAEAFASELGGDFLLLPTTPLLPPTVSDLSDDAEFGRANLLALRNPSLANCADGCSLAMPFGHNDLTLSAMLIGTRKNDAALLACGKAVEAVLSRLG